MRSSLSESKSKKKNYRIIIGTLTELGSLVIVNVELLLYMSGHEDAFFEFVWMFNMAPLYITELLKHIGGVFFVFFFLVVMIWFRFHRGTWIIGRAIINYTTVTICHRSPFNFLRILHVRFTGIHKLHNVHGILPKYTVHNLWTRHYVKYL